MQEPAPSFKQYSFHIDYDREIWSGLSWSAGEIKHKDILSGHPVTSRYSSAEKGPMVFEGRLYVVEY